MVDELESTMRRVEPRDMHLAPQLGHTQIQTTMRYAHVAMDPLRKATNQVSGVIAAMAVARGKAEVATEPE